jgi:peptidase E
VSATVKFDKEEYGPEQLADMINWSKDKVKDIAFLPLSPSGTYQQAPYEGITEEVYNAKKQNLQPLALSVIGDGDKQADLYCDGDACAI